MQRRTLLLMIGTALALPARALYDPKPITVLAEAPGTWEGSLVYRDYQKPDKMVTLKTMMVVSLAAPDELVLYYVFDDGPGKTVYSYEQMKFDMAANQIIWDSGTTKPNHSEYKITSSAIQDGKSTVTFERNSDTRTDKYSLVLTKTTWSLTKFESSLGNPEILRSKYEFKKREA
jgi:hypothetical protein